RSHEKYFHSVWCPTRLEVIVCACRHLPLLAAPQVLPENFPHPANFGCVGKLLAIRRPSRTRRDARPESDLSKFWLGPVGKQAGTASQKGNPQSQRAGYCQNSDQHLPRLEGRCRRRSRLASDSPDPEPRIPYVPQTAPPLFSPTMPQKRLNAGRG